MAATPKPRDASDGEVSVNIDERAIRLLPLVRVELTKMLGVIGVDPNKLPSLGKKFERFSSASAKNISRIAESLHIDDMAAMNYFRRDTNADNVAFVFECSTIYKNYIDGKPEIGTNYGNLYRTFERQLYERLIGHLDEADARNLARSTVAIFSKVSSLQEPEQVEAATELAGTLLQLYLRDFAPSAQNEFAKATTLPSSAPEIWSERDQPDRETAFEFLQRVYGSRLGVEGDLTLTALQRLDPDLVDELKHEASGDRAEELRALLPSPRARGDAKLLKALGYIPDDPMERQKALTVLARGERPGARGPYRKRSPR